MNQNLTLSDGSTIEFRNPPSAIRKTNRAALTREFVTQLAWRKGEWAVYRTGMKAGSAYATASAMRKEYPHVEWRASRDGDTFSIFAKVIYV